MIDHLDMINSNVRTVCMCKIKSIDFFVAVVAVLSLFYSHIKHCLNFPNPKDRHLNIVQRFYSGFYFLTSSLPLSSLPNISSEAWGFSIHKSAVICRAQTSVFFCINKMMLTSQWTKTSTFNSQTWMMLLSVDALISSFLVRYLHARVILCSTKQVIQRFRIGVIRLCISRELIKLHNPLLCLLFHK